MRTTRGSAVVEFALVVPLVLAVLLASVEVVVLGRTQLVVVHAAREGAREAAVSPDGARAVAAAQAALGPDLAARARVTVVRPEKVGAAAVVTVRLGHRFASPLGGGFVVHLSARTSMRVER